ncbi:anamorsin homolog [Tubulanus polymorphus]|uniref:anamorsin homolog n=1 Tax=Tubulanus polymorphus TaxID=672921 RepID=UPI003DA38CAB
MVASVDIKSGQTVLLLWGGKESPPESINSVVSELNKKVAATGKVQVEHVERLHLSAHKDSSFDVALSGFLHPASVIHDSDVLVEVARILKPSGCFYLREPTTDTDGDKLRSAEKLASSLKLAGFVNVSNASRLSLTPAELKDIQQALALTLDVCLTQISGQKPAYEVGAQTRLKLSFGAKKPKDVVKTAAVWSLSANDVLDDDIIDSDALLDEEDLKKPDPKSLKAECGPNSGRKKACKNCNCGLADELDAGGTPTQKTPQQASACGSCYLGDAFRCASCPYLGMPAFKPGDKVTLSERQLKADT